MLNKYKSVAIISNLFLVYLTVEPCLFQQQQAFKQKAVYVVFISNVSDRCGKANWYAIMYNTFQCWSF